MASRRPRMRAADRRDVVIRAAVREFATHGYAGTAAASIAVRAGVSQPYLFRLFGTKRSMFIAVVRYGFERCRTALEASAGAAGTHGTEGILEAMGRTYADLVVEGDLPRLQLQAFAAAIDDPEIRAVVRQESTELYAAVGRSSGADDDVLRAWFAQVTLISVAAAAGERTPGSVPWRPADR